MYVQLLVILAMVLVTQHVVSRDIQRKKMECGILEKNHNMFELFG